MDHKQPCILPLNSSGLMKSPAATHIQPLIQNLCHQVFLHLRVHVSLRCRSLTWMCQCLIIICLWTNNHNGLAFLILWTINITLISTFNRSFQSQPSSIPSDDRVVCHPLLDGMYMLCLSMLSSCSYRETL